MQQHLLGLGLASSLRASRGVPRTLPAEMVERSAQPHDMLMREAALGIDQLLIENDDALSPLRPEDGTDTLPEVFVVHPRILTIFRRKQAEGPSRLLLQRSDDEGDVPFSADSILALKYLGRLPPAPENLESLDGRREALMSRAHYAERDRGRLDHFYSP